MQKLGVLDSYDGGDQGFLNMYFHDLVTRPLFVYQNQSRAVDGMLRLPIEYNVHHSFFYDRCVGARSPADSTERMRHAS
jgi:hypothetical protein